MIIIDSPYHIIFSCLNENPTFSCDGKCKKSWWLRDFLDLSQDVCPLCRGGLTDAVEKVHFTVLKTSKKKLSLNDFKQFYTLDREDKVYVNNLLKSNVEIFNLGIVKKAFEDKAKQDWLKK
jgi:hypothetical protein